jgi:hypothetical protein
MNDASSQLFGHILTEMPKRSDFKRTSFQKQSFWKE